MRLISDFDLLLLWERGYGKPAWQQALLWLAAMHRQTPFEELKRWTIGRRDAELMQLRMQLFGSQLDLKTHCPHCHEVLEATCDLSAFPLAASLTAAPECEPHDLAVDDYRIQFRPPAIDDFDSLAQLPTAERKSALLARCLASVTQAETSIAVNELPDEVIDRVIREMAVRDPCAEIEIQLSCSACDATWTTLFDIVNYLWAEIDAWARRTFAQIHALASAYGWSESQVLALTPWRRQVYLNMVRS